MIKKRTVDDRLPKWLHSKILSAVDYIYQSHGNVEESLERVKKVDAQLNDEEMNWVMMLLILPKIKDMLKTSDAFRNFKAMKKETRH
tara:strand:+ start:317 stop:577 length:261 start_codon:yes stop_codon:yes gene_type:complete